MPERLQHAELWSSGIDEALQGVGGDPWGGFGSTGLRVPTLASGQDPSPQNRYLFMLGGLWLPEGVVARIIGIRQLLTLGTVQTFSGKKVLLEQEVSSPSFRLPDGNVSWHLTLVPPNIYDTLLADQQPPQAAAGIENLAFRMTDVPALVYETISPSGSGFYFDLTAYTAPNQGRPWGQTIGGFSNFSDKRFPWGTNQGLHPLDLYVEGPGFLAGWASVAQTAGVTITAPTDAGALPPEWRFVAAYTTSVLLWRIGMALDVEVLGVTDVGGGPPQVGGGR
jgi:hypothetical protein